MVKRGEFVLKDRAARFEPTVNPERAYRSLRLFLGSASECNMNTKSFSTFSTNSFCRRANFASSMTIEVMVTLPQWR